MKSHAILQDECCDLILTGEEMRLGEMQGPPTLHCQSRPPYLQTSRSSHCQMLSRWAWRQGRKREHKDSWEAVGGENSDTGIGILKQNCNELTVLLWKYSQPRLSSFPALLLWACAVEASEARAQGKMSCFITRCPGWQGWSSRAGKLLMSVFSGLMTPPGWSFLHSWTWKHLQGV